MSDKPMAGLDTIVAAKPDILLLTNFDYDAGQIALTTLRDRLLINGLTLEHSFSALPNTGMPTGVDVDGDGRRGGPRDAQGFGYFAGQGGQAILSRFPLHLLQDKTDMLWQDAKESLLAKDDPVGPAQRLSSSAHWAVRVTIEDRELTLLTLAATPPVFDGPEDRNGRRNHDEVMLWAHELSDKNPDLSQTPVVLLGNLNLDPDRGDGLRHAAAQVLRHPRIQDPLPNLPTVAWERVGDMRASYVLPDRAFQIDSAKVMPVSPDAGRHHLVWVDLRFP